MADEDRVEKTARQVLVERQGVASRVFRMRARIEDETRFTEFEEIGVGTNVRMGREIRETHDFALGAVKGWKGKGAF